MTIIDLARDVEYVTVPVPPVEIREEHLWKLAEDATQDPDAFDAGVVNTLLAVWASPMLGPDEKADYFEDFQTAIQFVQDVSDDPGLIYQVDPTLSGIDRQDDAVAIVKDTAESALDVLLHGKPTSRRKIA